MKDVEIDSQDLIEAISSQREAALNEIARMSAIIRALGREVDRLSVATSGSGGGHQDPG